jgi:hypothetical protein
MKYSLFPLIFVFLSILSASCTKEMKFTKEQLLKLAQSADSSFSYILPNSMTEGINCSDYPPGCISGHMVKVKGLEMIAIEFTTEAEARFAARKVKGYYARNWLFDDVTGEPDLERFVTEHLEAKKP